MLNFNYKVNRLLLLIFVYSIFLGISSCDSKKAGNEHAKVKINSVLSSSLLAKNAGKLTYGDTIDFNVKTSSDSLSINRTSVKKGQELLIRTKSSSFALSTTQLGVGNHVLNFTIELSNGKFEKISQKVFIKSDILSQKLTYHRVNKFPHDPDAYTQGLLFDNDRLIESTGQYGESTLRLTDLSSGSVKKKIPLDKKFFGEGIAVYGDKLYQLTWKQKTGFIYDKNSFEKIGSFNYPGEGWGITATDSLLVMSDGTNLLYFLDPITLTRKKIIQVYEEGNAVLMLNELEYINGKIYANVYQTDQIISIDPQNGRVIERIDLTGVFNKNNYGRRIDVLNGIAYNSVTNKIYVTGKYWPKLFEVEFVPVNQ